CRAAVPSRVIPPATRPPLPPKISIARPPHRHAGRRTLMRNSRPLAIGAFGVFIGAALLGAAYAQSQGNTGVVNNPTINTGNTPPHVMTVNGKVVPTPIAPSLLPSGQPCQQVVTINGLVPNTPLPSLQRGFDFYSWLTFIALNSPADG